MPSYLDEIKAKIIVISDEIESLKHHLEFFRKRKGDYPNLSFDGTIERIESDLEEKAAERKILESKRDFEQEVNPE